MKQSGPDRGDPSVSVVIAVVVDLLYSLGLYVDNTVFSLLTIHLIDY